MDEHIFHDAEESPPLCPPQPGSNMLVIGESEHGANRVIRDLIEETLELRGRVVIIDAEGAWSDDGAAVGGRAVRLAPGGPYPIDPFRAIRAAVEEYEFVEDLADLLAMVGGPETGEPTHYLRACLRRLLTERPGRGKVGDLDLDEIYTALMRVGGGEGAAGFAALRAAGGFGMLLGAEGADPLFQGDLVQLDLSAGSARSARAHAIAIAIAVFLVHLDLFRRPAFERRSLVVVDGGGIFPRDAAGVGLLTRLMSYCGDYRANVVLRIPGYRLAGDPDLRIDPLARLCETHVLFRQQLAGARTYGAALARNSARALGQVLPGLAVEPGVRAEYLIAHADGRTLVREALLGRTRA
ncbi:MAG: hypothetical protein DI556_13400 [Rhodovulum sulfidophilum]|uniref:Uncharacterized protein n=1 Tax=Rhodovulum sulfidophilum TaxID=35806 RepID=A0A2W5NDK0_RHOSU|nr:MAG: hypothetical protein DI556_13400 [Rhodovulum sulfidophilum]